MEHPLLVSPQWLHDNLSNPAVEVIENAWVTDSYAKAHITGAYRVPTHPYLKEFTAEGERTLHIMTPETFAALCHDLGLTRDKHYVIYDDYFGLFATRFWYVCRYFGLHNVSVLDGSWRGWLSQGRPVSSNIETPPHGSDIIVQPQDAYLVGMKELRNIYSDPGVQLWDTRRAGEYTGTEQTANQRQGHIPHSLNLAWTDLLTEQDNEGGPCFLKPLNVLDQTLTSLGLMRNKTIITYCQSGNRAAFCNFVLEMLGYPDHRLYDASMNEWANLKDTPMDLYQQ